MLVSEGIRRMCLILLSLKKMFEENMRMPSVYKYSAFSAFSQHSASQLAVVEA